MKNITILFLLLLFASCKKDSPEIPQCWDVVQTYDLVYVDPNLPGNEHQVTTWLMCDKTESEIKLFKSQKDQDRYDGMPQYHYTIVITYSPHK